MGVRELRETFNMVASPAYSCRQAFLGYDQAHDAESQILTFSGTKADGSPFVEKSRKIRPNEDVVSVARETAQKLVGGAT